MAIPEWLLTVLGWSLGAGAVCTIVLWGYVLHLLRHSMRVVPTLRLGQSLALADPPSGRVCVVVPAHNESRVIAGLVRSLRNETYPQLHVVLALDRCTDDTAALARAEIGDDARFEIVEIAACPDEWVGKVHAVHAGVTRSRGAADADFLLFADADTIFSPGCITASLALMRHRRLDLLSLHSTLTHDAWFERLVQPAAALELMRQYPLTYANAIGKPRPFANGQFMLFKRDAYEAVGGHESVKGSLMDDLDLARGVHAAERKGGLFLAAGLFHCRMYADWRGFRRGWKRIYIGAAGRGASRLTASAWRVRWLGAILPVATQGAGLLGALVLDRDPGAAWMLLALWLVATAVWLGTLLQVVTLLRAPAWIAPLHIIGAWLTANLLREAAGDLRARRPTRWGGRDYDLGG